MDHASERDRDIIYSNRLKLPSQLGIMNSSLTSGHGIEDG
jgi:hypothetical protein